jgi:small subunit ribosomal protein S2
VKEAAERAGMPYVNQRWLGGLLTNWNTISKRIQRLHQLRDWEESGTMDLLPTRERLGARSELEKLEMNLGGVANLQRQPDAVFVVDMKTEEIGVREAKRLKIPLIGLVDTNCDPDPVNFVIPGNDDAIRSCKLIVDAIGDVAAERAQGFRQAEEERFQREEEERLKREAEEQAKKEAEDHAKREAEELAKREAEERGEAPPQPPQPQKPPPPPPRGARDEEMTPEEIPTQRSFDPAEEEVSR